MGAATTGFPIKAAVIHFTALSRHEQYIVSRALCALRTQPRRAQVVRRRVSNLKRLVRAMRSYSGADGADVERFGKGTVTDLADAGRFLFLPARVALRRGYLIAKIQTFAFLTQEVTRLALAEYLVQELRQVQFALVCMLMTEDLYLSLMEQEHVPARLKTAVTHALVALWEQRPDERARRATSALHQVWCAREHLAPSFGSMLGSSELFLLSTELDEMWRDFLVQRLSEAGVCTALEEFLFGISHEQIQAIRLQLRAQGVAALSRQEAYALIGEKGGGENTQAHAYQRVADLCSFYRSFIIRKRDAQARLRLNMPGPVRTIEEHYVEYLFFRQGEACFVH